MPDNPEHREAVSTWPEWRIRLHNIIFESDTPAGRFFDLALLALIILSIILVMLETVEPIDTKYHSQIESMEWFITICFTIEYFARLISVRRPWKYATSFYGLVDLFSTLPSYLTIFYPGSNTFVVIRALRLMRVFRILKLGRFSNASYAITKAIRASSYKIIVFLIFMVIMVTIIGAIMYFIENPHNEGFSSMPESMYWAIVTLTTVGYGDISPITPLGKFLASIIMILGYGIIAVPTGLVSAEMALTHQKGEKESYDYLGIACINCGAESHTPNSQFCSNCGYPLHESD